MNLHFKIVMVIMFGVFVGSVKASIIYDETVDGALPFSLTSLTDEERASYTFQFTEGINTIQGTSTSGEAFAFKIADGDYLKSISVSFYTHISNNDHILDIDRFLNSGSILYNSFSLSVAGTNYQYLVDLPDTIIGGGIYNVYSGTSVQGASNENPFSINFEVATIVPLPTAVWLFGSGLLGLVGMARRKKTA